MKCTKLLSKLSTDFWGLMKCTTFVMDEMYKSTNFLRNLNMNTAEFGCSGCLCVYLVVWYVWPIIGVKLGVIQYALHCLKASP